MISTELEELRRACPAAFYRPNTAASEEWILEQGGWPGSRSTGDEPFFHSDAHGRADLGGNRVGKSAKLVLEGGSFAMGFRPWEPQDSEWFTRGLKDITREPARINFVVPNKTIHIAETVKELRKWWPERTDRNPNGWWWPEGRTEQGQPAGIRWITDSLWRFLSHHMDKEDFEGTESDLNIFDEPSPEELWVALNRGLVSTGGRWILGATLLKSGSWFSETVVNRALQRPQGRIRVFYHSIWDNTAENGGCPTQTCQSVRDFLDEIGDPDLRLAREHGHAWEQSGLIVAGFNKDRHMTRPFQLNLGAKIFSAIDPAGARPFAALHVAYLKTPGGKTPWEGHIFDETVIPQSAKDLGLFARTFMNKERGEGYPVHPTPSHLILIDPIAQETQNLDPMGRSLRQILQLDHGIVTRLAQRRNKNARLMDLNSHFLSNHYYLWTNCRRALAEIEGWRWDPSSPKLTAGADDLMDCLSYIHSAQPYLQLKPEHAEEEAGIYERPEYRSHSQNAKTEAARMMVRFQEKLQEQFREEARAN